MTSSLAGSNRTAMSVPCLRKTRCPVGANLASAASFNRTRHSRVSSRRRASQGCESQACFITVNSTAFPLGSQDGRRWLASSRFGSGLVKVSGFPPSAETFRSPAVESSAKTMLSSRPQFAPNIKGASHSAVATPPSTGIFFNLPSVQNPTQRLSGERKGLIPPSVPVMGFASDWSILRRNKRGFA